MGGIFSRQDENLDDLFRKQGKTFNKDGSFCYNDYSVFDAQRGLKKKKYTRRSDE